MTARRWNRRWLITFCSVPLLVGGCRCDQALDAGTSSTNTPPDVENTNSGDSIAQDQEKQSEDSGGAGSPAADGGAGASNGDRASVRLTGMDGTPFDVPSGALGDGSRVCPGAGVWAVRVVGTGSASGVCLDIVDETVVGYYDSCNRPAGNALTMPAGLKIEDGRCRAELSLSNGVTLEMTAARVTDRFYAVMIVNTSTGQTIDAQMLPAALVDGPG